MVLDVSGISIRSIDVAFGKAKALERLSLEIRPSEFVVLLGPSGCGKSTLLNAIAGLIEVDGGQIFIGGRNVTWEEPSERGIAMVFQTYALYPRMTVRRNMAFGLQVAGTPRAEIDRRVAEAAALLKLEPFLDRRPAALSGGQRQRVAMGRALVRHASVFLFDEPLSNLDAQLRAELRIEIKRLHRRLGSTMIYVTHDQIEAMTLADRVVVMKDGAIRQVGTPDEVYGQPADRFVASFVGSPAMSFLPGRLEMRPLPTFVGDGWSVGLPDRVRADREEARGADLGVRPENVRLCSPGKGDLDATVDVIESTGHDRTVWLRRGEVSLAARLNGDTPPPSPGEAVGLTILAARASLFDGTTGLRF